MGLEYQGSMYKLVLRFQLLGRTLIFTPVHTRGSHYLFTKGERGYKRKPFESFFNLSDILQHKSPIRFPFQALMQVTSQDWTHSALSTVSTPLLQCILLQVPCKNIFQIKMRSLVEHNTFFNLRITIRSLVKFHLGISEISILLQF